ncbi:hypothetical protein WN944_021526 [Citrus x changshan-huyou]|uniref:Uncharacterized protein n=1 Tax=Citrus x changshan-huyou TaxID=2935761 RepID=A0AAP0N3B0_9ROSI
MIFNFLPSGTVGKLIHSAIISSGSDRIFFIVTRVGNGGSVACGRVGIDGIGGNATLGIGGSVGRGPAGACKRLRAAMLISKLDNDNATSIDNRKQCLRAAILCFTNIGKSRKQAFDLCGIWTQVLIVF